MADVLTHNQTFASSSEALAHYGKKGMKWGVITEDPPAGNSNKRADQHQQNADRIQREIDKIHAQPAARFKFQQRGRDNRAAELSKVRDREQKSADDLRSGRHLTDSQRKVLIGAAVVGGIFAASATYKYVDSGQAQQHKINLQQKMSNKQFSWKKDMKLSRYTKEDDIYNNVVKQVNPGFGGRGTKMNCRRCTFAYEMRRRGYDVKATKSSSATGQTPTGVHNAINPGSRLKTGKWGMLNAMAREGMDGETAKVLNEGTWGKNQIGDKDFFKKSQAVDRSSKIFRSLSEHPEGARGELGVGWTFGGGHSMAWEIVRGRPVIFDAQSGKKYSNPEDFQKFAAHVTDAGFTRLDNLKLNEEFLKRWVQNAD